MSAPMKNKSGEPMFYEDREPTFFDKVWICLCRYWND
jgi:hypothetical protein